MTAKQAARITIMDFSRPVSEWTVLWTGEDRESVILAARDALQTQHPYASLRLDSPSRCVRHLRPVTAW